MSQPLTLQQHVDIVEQEISALPAYSYETRGIYDTAVREAGQRITYRTGAATLDDWRGARVKLGGIRATSTGGIVQALHNWLAAARKRLAQ